MDKYALHPEFSLWYQSYPRKVGKAKALEAWLKCSDRPPIDQLLTILQRQIKHEQQWQGSNKYIPHPSTYINQCRFEDEIEIQTPPPDTPFARNIAATKEYLEKISSITLESAVSPLRAAVGEEFRLGW